MTRYKISPRMAQPFTCAPAKQEEQGIRRYDRIRHMKLHQITGRFQLAKIRLCLLIGLSALFGFLMAAGELSVLGILLAIGIFLLAMGGATLNSWQERALDSRMQRTRKRPMAVGEFSSRQAFIQASLLIVGGWLILAGTASFSVALFALTGLVIYNMVYTPLKRKSQLAIFPGAVCGAIPPCVGWLGGGGSLYDYHFWLLFGLFFLWQMPHFWLVMMMHQKDYIKGPYPSLLDQFPTWRSRVFSYPG